MSDLNGKFYDLAFEKHTEQSEIDFLKKRIAELEAVLTKLNNIGGLGLDKHKWIEEALKGGAE